MRTRVWKAGKRLGQKGRYYTTGTTYCDHTYVHDLHWVQKVALVLGDVAPKVYDAHMTKEDVRKIEELIMCAVDAAYHEGCFRQVGDPEMGDHWEGKSAGFSAQASAILEGLSK